MAVDGYGNSWIDLLEQGAPFGNRFHMLKPFAANDGGKPQAFLSHGFISMNAYTKVLPIGVSDPTDGYFSATEWSKGQTADVHFQDGLIDILLGHRPMSDYDDIVKAWQTEAGETVRKEFMDSMATRA